jgi:hypothetical protein
MAKPRVWTKETLGVFDAMYRNGAYDYQIAEAVGCGAVTVFRLRQSKGLKANGQSGPPNNGKSARASNITDLAQARLAAGFNGNEDRIPTCPRMYAARLNRLQEHTDRIRPLLGMPTARVVGTPGELPEWIDEQKGQDDES